MSIYKVNFFFSRGKQGWSETYYTTDVPEATAKSKAQTLLQKRVSLLGNDVSIEEARLSDDSVQRDAVLIPTGGLPVFGPYESVPGFVCWCVRLFSGSKYWRHSYLRSYPQITDNPQTDAEKALTKQWGQALAQFLNYLTGGSFTMKILERPPTNPNIGISTFSPNTTTGKTLVTTVSAHGLVEGNTVAIYNLRGYKPLPGRRLVRTATSTTFEIDYVPVGVYPLYNGKAFARKVTASYPVLNDWNELGLRHRDVGRPFGVQAGARRRNR